MSLPGDSGADHHPRVNSPFAPEAGSPTRSGRASVSTEDLEALTRSVEWANFLNADPSGSHLLDPCCMLEALSDVYQAAHRLVDESNQWRAGLSSGSTP